MGPAGPALSSIIFSFTATERERAPRPATTMPPSLRQRGLADCGVVNRRASTAGGGVDKAGKVSSAGERRAAVAREN